MKLSCFDLDNSTAYEDADISDYVLLLYQLKDGLNYHITRALFNMPLRQLTEAGYTVELGNYRHVYTGVIKQGGESVTESLMAVWEKFNKELPKDFTGRTISVGDVVVLCQNGELKAYYADFYIDKFTFREAPGFTDTLNKGYLTHNPADVAAHLKVDSVSEHTFSYNKCGRHKTAAFQTWGFFIYDAPSVIKQTYDYFFQSASNYPGNVRVSPYQFEV